MRFQEHDPLFQDRFCGIREGQYMEPSLNEVDLGPWYFSGCILCVLQGNMQGDTVRCHGLTNAGVAICSKGKPVYLCELLYIVVQSLGVKPLEGLIPLIRSINIFTLCSSFIMSLIKF